MNILIITAGSRGDVQPFVALGKGLMTAGHQVTLCTTSNFESFVTDHGLAYGYMDDGLIELIQSEDGRGIVEDATNMFKIIVLMIRLMKKTGPLQQKAFDDSWEAAKTVRPDLILYHPKAFGGPHFAEVLGASPIMVQLQPMLVPSGEFPCIGFPALPLGRWYNLATHKLVQAMMQFSTRRYVKAWRRREGLPVSGRTMRLLHTSRGEPIPVMHCYSRHVGPAPSDWPDTIGVTGFCYLDATETWSPPKALRDFLNAGEPPVYVGFGSMAGRNPERLTRTVVDAFRKSGARGILASGWGGLSPDELPDTLFMIEQAPHDWLFPRVAAVVHHGGAGTTAAGLRDGRPTVICPFFGDQPFWGQRVHDLGAGPKPIPQKRLTADNLAEALNAVTRDEQIRQNAARLGELIRAEDGIGNAVAFIERFAAGTD